MNNDLLQRLMAAQTDEERSWIATESLLESLPEDVKTALWAVAIPHWFDAEILAALCPELADRANDIYRQLQMISCVEVFPERGHNVHEVTRNQLLDRLWKDNPEHFRELSGRAAAYFARSDQPEMQIEWIYHLVVINPYQEFEALSNLLEKWSRQFRKSQIESLLNNLQEQVKANRVPITVTIFRKTLASLLSILGSQDNNNGEKDVAYSRASNKKQAREKASALVNGWTMTSFGTSFLGYVGLNAMTGVDVAMVIQIASCYGLNLDQNTAALVFTTIVAPVIRNRLSQPVYALGAISFLGSLGSFIFFRESLVAAGITKAVGEALIMYFESYSDLPD